MKAEAARLLRGSKGTNRKRSAGQERGTRWIRTLHNWKCHNENYNLVCFLSKPNKKAISFLCRRMKNKSDKNSVSLYINENSRGLVVWDRDILLRWRITDCMLVLLQLKEGLWILKTMHLSLWVSYPNQQWSDLKVCSFLVGSTTGEVSATYPEPAALIKLDDLLKSQLHCHVGSNALHIQEHSSRRLCILYDSIHSAPISKTDSSRNQGGRSESSSTHNYLHWSSSQNCASYSCGFMLFKSLSCETLSWNSFIRRTTAIMLLKLRVLAKHFGLFIPLNL